MKKDERLRRLAENVLCRSIGLKKGEKVYIEAFGVSTKALFEEFIAEAVRIGAVPFYFFNDNAFIKSFAGEASSEQMNAYGAMHRGIMEQCQAYVGIRGNDDIFALSDLGDEQNKLWSENFGRQVHMETRIPKTRWCVLRYPNETMAAFSKMSVEAFENFYFDACLLDYAKMGRAMDALQHLMEKTDRVKIIAPETHLEFSIKGIPVLKSFGSHNIPDGEVFTAPVRNSINGYVRFNTETTYMGTVFSNIFLKFENGKIVEGRSMLNDEKFQNILNIDDGSRYIGEFALGLNPYITQPILDILFDEKIGGSFHMAIGYSYDDAFNGNKSSIHWDLVQMQDEKHGGGEIWFDDVLIRRNGRFVLPELEALNSENLR